MFNDCGVLHHVLVNILMLYSEPGVSVIILRGSLSVPSHLAPIRHCSDPFLLGLAALGRIWCH